MSWSRPWYMRFVSPSRLDEYLQYISGKDFKGDDFTANMYIDKLLKIEEPTSRRKADAGTACHLVLEKSDHGKSISKCTANVDSKVWSIDWQLDADIYVPTSREQWIHSYVCDELIIGKVDAIDATSVHDHKFTSYVDIEKYIMSMQWKLYLLMTKKDAFVYNIFSVEVLEHYDAVIVKSYDKLELYRYKAMSEQVLDTLSDYIKFLKAIKEALSYRIQQYNQQSNIKIKEIF